MVPLWVFLLFDVFFLCGMHYGLDTMWCMLIYVGFELMVGFSFGFAAAVAVAADRIVACPAMRTVSVCVFICLAGVAGASKTRLANLGAHLVWKGRRDRTALRMRLPFSTAPVRDGFVFILVANIMGCYPPRVPMSFGNNKWKFCSHEYSAA